MQSLTAIVAGVKSHWPTILFFAAWWIAVGKVLASRWPQPAATEPRWDRALHFALVNLPAFAASKLDGQTFRLLGIPFPVSLPVVGWTARARETKPDNAGPIKLGAMLPLLLIPALLASGCAPSAAYIGALKFETGAATISMDARDAWHKYDAGHQMDIVAGAATLADGAQRLAAWRGVQSKVDAGFAAVRDAIAALSGALNAAGAAQRGDFGTALADVAAAVGRLSSLLAQYGVHLQGLPMVLNMRLLVPDLAVAMIVSSGGVL